MSKTATDTLQGAPLEEIFQRLDPQRFGWTVQGDTYSRTFEGIGEVVVCRLRQEHGEVVAFTEHIRGVSSPVSVFDFIVRLQDEIFFYARTGTVAVTTALLAKLEQAGGTILAAYRADKGFTPEGWLGLQVSVGGEDGCAYSHVSGIRKELRTQAGLGWHLKVLQCYSLAQQGYRSVLWSYAGAQGVNAYFNIEKMAGVVEDYFPSMLGPAGHPMSPSPIERAGFDVRVDLFERRVLDRIEEVHRGVHQAPAYDSAEIQALPRATADNLDEILRTRPPRLRVDLLDDVWSRYESDVTTAMVYERDLSASAARLLNTHGLLQEVGEGDLAGAKRAQVAGPYRIVGFASSIEDGVRRNAYVFELKPSAPEIAAEEALPRAARAALGEDIAATFDRPERLMPPPPAHQEMSLMGWVTAFAPWIAYLSLAGFGGIWLTAAPWAGIGLSVGLGYSYLRRGFIMDWGGLFFFFSVAIVGSLLRHPWVLQNALVLGNVALFLVVALSMAVGKPFALQYAQAVGSPVEGHSPIVVGISWGISAIWCVALGLMAVATLMQAAGWFGGVVSNVIQAGLVALAAVFSGRYPSLYIRRRRRAFGYE